MAFDPKKNQDLAGTLVIGQSGLRCVIDQFHASGGHAEVYRAHLENDRHSVVAIKFPKPNGTRDSSFEREANLLQRLPLHANLVRSFGFVTGVGEFERGLALEWAPESLLTLGPRLCWQEFVTIFSGLARGVSHLHQHGVIHRDISSENVVFSPLEPEIPKLTDFGIAIDQNGPQITADHFKFAKPGASHPCTPQMGPDPILDLYALAATCYRALTNKLLCIPAAAFESQEGRYRLRPEWELRLGEELALHYHALHTDSVLSPQLAQIIVDLIAGHIVSADDLVVRLQKLTSVSLNQVSSDPLPPVDSEEKTLNRSVTGVPPTAFNTDMIIGRCQPLSGAPPGDSSLPPTRRAKLSLNFGNLALTVLPLVVILLIVGWTVGGPRFDSVDVPHSGSLDRPNGGDQDETGRTPSASVAKVTANLPSDSMVSLPTGTYQVTGGGELVVGQKSGKQCLTLKTPNGESFLFTIGPKAIVRSGEAFPKTAAVSSSIQLSGVLDGTEITHEKIGTLSGASSQIDLNLKFAPNQQANLKGKIKGEFEISSPGPLLADAGVTALRIEEVSLEFKEDGQACLQLAGCEVQVPVHEIQVALHQGLKRKFAEASSRFGISIKDLRIKNDSQGDEVPFSVKLRLEPPTRSLVKVFKGVDLSLNGRVKILSTPLKADSLADAHVKFEVTLDGLRNTLLGDLSPRFSGNWDPFGRVSDSDRKGLSSVRNVECQIQTVDKSFLFTGAAIIQVSE